MSRHEYFMNRCLQLAQNGLGTTYPNPLVGSVIVYNNTIIGEGWHYKSGEPHAEVHAITSVKNKKLLTEATIYVSLEPCSHIGKTPPCANLILSHGIKNVVIGSKDPNPKVSGNGIKVLQNSGSSVMFGVLEEECINLNRRFFTFHQKHRPYVILKWAQTSNGYLAPKTKKHTQPVWITNRYSRQLVHKWRAEEQAILVGTKTVLDDNPSLTVRDWTGTQPLRCIIDRDLKIKQTAQVFNNQAPTLVFTDKKKLNTQHICYEQMDFSTSKVAQQFCDILYSHQIQSVIIEGGAQTLQTFINEDCWDEARIFTGNQVFDSGIEAPRVSGKTVDSTHIFDDSLLILRND